MLWILETRPVWGPDVIGSCPGSGHVTMWKRITSPNLPGISCWVPNIPHASSLMQLVFTVEWFLLRLRPGVTTRMFTFHKSGHKSDDHTSNREDMKSSLIFTNFNKFKFIDLTLFHSASSSVTCKRYHFLCPRLKRWLPRECPSLWLV